MATREMRHLYRRASESFGRDQARGLMQSTEQAARVLSTDQLDVKPEQVAEFMNMFFGLDAKGKPKPRPSSTVDFAGLSFSTATAVHDLYDYGARAHQSESAILSPEALRTTQLMTTLIEDSLQRTSIFEYVDRGGNVRPAILLVNSLAKVYNQPVHRDQVSITNHEPLLKHLQQALDDQTARRQALIAELGDYDDEAEFGDPTIEGVETEQTLIVGAQQNFLESLRNHPNDPRSILYLMKHSILAADFYKRSQNRRRTSTLYQEVARYPKLGERVYDLSTGEFAASQSEQPARRSAVHFDSRTLPLGAVLAEQYFLPRE